MKLEADARIPFSREVVFATYRDRLPQMVPFLPNVKAIQVQKREEPAPGISTLLNLWEAKAEVPKVAQGVLKPEMLAWLDHASWNQNDWTCDWRIETRMFTENVRCSGRNTYLVEGDLTILQIRGNLEVKLDGVPGVPRFLAGTVAPHVEKFIVQLLTPNLLSVAKGLEDFLRSEQLPKT